MFPAQPPASPPYNKKTHKHTCIWRNCIYFWKTISTESFQPNAYFVFWIHWLCYL